MGPSSYFPPSWQIFSKQSYIFVGKDRLVILALSWDYNHIRQARVVKFFFTYISIGTSFTQVGRKSAFTYKV